MTKGVAVDLDSTATHVADAPPKMVMPNPSVMGVSTHLRGSVLPIVRWPDPILSQQSKDVVEFDDELGQLIMDMSKTMLVNDGIGLAAPQVGKTENVIIIRQGDSLMTLVNPSIIDVDDHMKSMREGCLSVPGYFEDRKRPQSVVVSYQTPPGIAITAKFHGMVAFVVQHEMDHLKGKTFVDDLSPLKKSRVRKKITKTLKG